VDLELDGTLDHIEHLSFHELDHQLCHKA
jgi:hypothetical protein